MNTQNAFSIVAIFYSLANLGSMGLELNLRETLKSLRSVRVAGADPRVVLGGRSGLGGPADEDPADGGALRRGVAHLRSGAHRADVADPHPKGPGRHFPRGGDHAAGRGQHRDPDAVAGAAPDPGADAEQLGHRKAAPAHRAVAAGDRRGHQGLRGAGGRQDFPVGEKDRGDLHLASARFRGARELAGAPQHPGQFCHRGPSPVHPRLGAGGLRLWFRSEPGPARGHGAGGLLAQWQCHADGRHRLSGHRSEVDGDGPPGGPGAGGRLAGCWRSFLGSRAGKTSARSAP